MGIQKSTLHANFQHIGCQSLLREPPSKFRNMLFLRIFKNSYLGFQATNLNLVTSIFKYLSSIFSKNYRNTLASHPYICLLLKTNTVSSKRVALKKYTENRNLTLWTSSDWAFEGFDINFKFLIAEFNLVELL